MSDHPIVLTGKVFSSYNDYEKYLGAVIISDYKVIYKYIPRFSDEDIPNVNFELYKYRFTLTNWYKVTMVCEIESIVRHYSKKYPNYLIDYNIKKLKTLLDEKDYLMVNLTSTPLVIRTKNKKRVLQRVIELTELEDYLFLLRNSKIQK